MSIWTFNVVVGAESVRACFRSWNGYEDELAWGASWLYRATNNSYYLAKAEEFFEDLKWNLGVLSWDDKTVATFANLAELTGTDYTQITLSIHNSLHKEPHGSLLWFSCIIHYR